MWGLCSVDFHTFHITIAHSNSKFLLVQLKTVKISAKRAHPWHIYLSVAVRYSYTEKVTEKAAHRMKISLVWLVAVLCVSSIAARPQRKARARSLLAEPVVPAINANKEKGELERLGELQFVSIDSSKVK